MTKHFEKVERLVSFSKNISHEMFHGQDPTRLASRGVIGRPRLDRAVLFSKPNSQPQMGTRRFSRHGRVDAKIK